MPQARTPRKLAVETVATWQILTRVVLGIASLEGPNLGGNFPGDPVLCTPVYRHAAS
jgi:hypothetical protein